MPGYNPWDECHDDSVCAGCLAPLDPCPGEPGSWTFEGFCGSVCRLAREINQGRLVIDLKRLARGPANLRGAIMMLGVMADEDSTIEEYESALNTLKNIPGVAGGEDGAD